ncbi:protein of unknown function [Candidatus Nitrospira inopinata]|uniref:Uncharacterized protein n=1 Tax=Candidatus Nitrospira inopinata TaxID=1715989 RepID=A0A0S4KX14_9BACT|nr:protein of unknown function [Candidatus Nitrospira inopinata]
MTALLMEPHGGENPLYLLLLIH